MPTQTGSYFDGTLTYLCEHNDGGAMGLIVNRKSNLNLGELLQYSGTPTDDEALGARAVLEGGPVGVEQGFVLHTADVEYDQSMKLTAQTVLSSHPNVLRQIAAGTGPRQFIIALGYAGWGPGQLDHELKQDAWISVQAPPELLFSTTAQDRLDHVARSAGIDLSRMGGRIGHA